MQSRSEILFTNYIILIHQKCIAKKFCCFPKLFAKYQMSNFWNNCNRQNSWAYLKLRPRSITMHFFHKSCRLASSWAAMPSGGALGRYLGRHLDFVMIFWTISGTVFCGDHIWGRRCDVWNQFGNFFLELTLNELWTRVSSRSITMHFLSWKLSSGLKSGSNAFWGALEGLAPPLSMTSPVLFALALTSLSLKMA